MPGRFVEIDSKVRRGEFGDALRDLLNSGDSHKPEYHSRSAELYLRDAQFEKAAQAAARGIRDSRSSATVKASCLEVQAFILREDGRLQDAVHKFRDAIREAESSRDLALLSRVQLSALSVLLDAEGVHGCAPFAVDARRNVLRSGDSQLFATLHLRYGFIEGRRGCQDLAERHLDAAERLLKTDANSYLQGMVWVARSVVSCLNDDVHFALACARRALELAERHDHHAIRRAALGNLAQLTLVAGDLPACDEFIDAALEGAAEDSHFWRCVMDTAIQLAVAQGDFANAAKKLAQLEGNRTLDPESPSWPNIEVNLSRIRLLLSTGRSEDALRLAERAIRLTSGRQEGSLLSQLARRE